MTTTTIKAEVAGTVFELTAKAGEAVAAGQTILILESMKMEIPVDSTAAGTLVKLLVEPGEVVAQGQDLAVIE